MAKLKQFQDTYRFPGFVPFAHIHGIFGDPLAVVISLQRRRKKRLVALWSGLPQLLRQTAPTGLEPFQKFAEMIEAHWDGIEAYCYEENKVPLGFVEGPLKNAKSRKNVRASFHE